MEKEGTLFAGAPKLGAGGGYELAALEARAERDREALLKNYSEMIPDALDTLEPEERHHVYKMLRLETVAFPDGTLGSAEPSGRSFLFVREEPTTR